MSPAYRQYFLSNRDRWKVNIGADLVVTPGLTLSPSFKYQDDHYGLDKYSESGLTDSRFYSIGTDVTYIFNPDTSIRVGYMREFGTQLVNNCNCDTHSDSSLIPIPSKYLETNDRATVDTVTALVRWAAVPEVLDLSLRYAVSRGVDHLQVNAQSGASAIDTQFPDVTTWFQRLDATAVYTFDKDALRRMGWKGKVKAKLHYAWERNAVEDWAIDTVAPYNIPNWGSGNAMVEMAWNNPNYNVHMLMGSLVFSW